MVTTEHIEDKQRSRSIATVDSCCVTESVPNITEAEAEEYAGWMRALADPTRIRILNLLAQTGEPVCVCEFVDRFPLGQSTISHHLKILRDVRFVFAERRGTFMYYQLNHACIGAFPEAVRRIVNL